MSSNTYSILLDNVHVLGTPVGISQRGRIMPASRTKKDCMIQRWMHIHVIHVMLEWKMTRFSPNLIVMRVLLSKDLETIAKD